MKRNLTKLKVPPVSEGGNLLRCKSGNPPGAFGKVINLSTPARVFMVI